MNAVERVVLLVVSDAALTQELIGELGWRSPGPRPAGRLQFAIATSVAQARTRLSNGAPVAILLDDSAVEEPSRLVGTVRELARVAPVVLLVAPERQEELGRLRDLVSRGGVDCVARTGGFLPLAVGLLERRLRLAEQSETVRERAGAEALGNFGELLRHEVNNPLTGILGNAELLLARRDRLPADAVRRLETIAELAVRLRETVRQLSETWEAGTAQTHEARPERTRKGRYEPARSPG